MPNAAAAAAAVTAAAASAAACTNGAGGGRHRPPLCAPSPLPIPAVLRALCNAKMTRASIPPHVPSAAAPLAMHFLGLDSSTQSLTGVLVLLPAPDAASASKIVWEASVNFQERLPHYQTTSGVIKDGAVVQAPPLMWVEAVDLLMQQVP